MVNLRHIENKAPILLRSFKNAHTACCDIIQIPCGPQKLGADSVGRHARNRIATLSEGYGDEFGAEIPCTPYVDNEGEHIGEAILKHKNRAPAILLGNHGVFTWGDSPSSAAKAAVMTEDVAKTVWLSMQLGTPQAISAEEAEKWYDRYHNRYGQ